MVVSSGEWSAPISQLIIRILVLLHPANLRERQLKIAIHARADVGELQRHHFDTVHGDDEDNADARVIDPLYLSVRPTAALRFRLA